MSFTHLLLGLAFIFLTHFHWAICGSTTSTNTKRLYQDHNALNTCITSLISRKNLDLSLDPELSELCTNFLVGTFRADNLSLPTSRYHFQFHLFPVLDSFGRIGERKVAQETAFGNMVRMDNLVEHPRLIPYKDSSLFQHLERKSSRQNLPFLQYPTYYLMMEQKKLRDSSPVTIPHTEIPQQIFDFAYKQLQMEEGDTCINGAAPHDEPSKWNITMSALLHGRANAFVTHMFLHPFVQTVHPRILAPLIQGYEYNIWDWERGVFLNIIRTLPLDALYLKEKLKIDMQDERWKKDATQMNVKISTANHPDLKKHNPSFFSMLSLNLQNVEPPLSMRVEKINALLQTLKPDVVTFQEVRLDEQQEIGCFQTTHSFPLPSSQQKSASECSLTSLLEGRHQVQHFRDLLVQQGYHYHTSQSAMSYITALNPREFPPLRNEEGLAIFSKYPIVDSSHLLLHRDLYHPHQHQRVLLRSLIDMNGTKMGVYTTHLSLDESARNQQVSQIVKYQNSKSEELALLTGDFNAEPQESSILHLEKMGLLDVHKEWRSREPTCPEYTFSTDFSRRKRIDYIMMKPQRGWTAEDLRIIRSSAFDEEEKNLSSLALSDHYALFVRFTRESTLRE